MHKALPIGGTIQKSFGRRTKTQAAGAGQACSGRCVRMGKYQACRAKVQTRDGPELSEKPVGNARCLFRGWPIELSNNRAERSIKPFVISRKNFLFANTADGAQSTAALFSLIETAQEEGLDPYRYLVWVFREAPRRFTQDSHWAASLLPQFAPNTCRPSTNP